MRNLTYGIIITVVFIVISKVVFEFLYSFNIISGILTGPHIGFILFKIYTIILVLFCMYKLFIYRNVMSMVREWLPLTIFALFSSIFCFIFLNL